MITKVTMTHPNLPGQPIDVPPGSVKSHESSGWIAGGNDTEEEAGGDGENPDERAALLAEADALGIEVNRRLGAANLRAAIDEAKASTDAGTDEDATGDPDTEEN